MKIHFSTEESVVEKIPNLRSPVKILCKIIFFLNTYTTLDEELIFSEFAPHFHEQQQY